MKDGFIRVGGRLRNAPVDFDVKHPIILPHKHHVTEMIIREHHVSTHHSGMGSTWTSLRQRFWIVKGGAMVKSVIRKCMFCRRRSSPGSKQIMADLPKERVTPGERPFAYVGVDYFGHFLVKQGRNGSAVAYGTVSYLRLINEDGKIHVAFLLGKARLAPIKTVSIPRLELTAAALAVKLDLFLRRELDFGEIESTKYCQETVPREKWQTGRVMETTSDKLGAVRQVTVKTSRGLLRRPIAKLCLIHRVNE
ncbi:uncharacterized protein LOC144425694 [Styela clava]